MKRPTKLEVQKNFISTIKGMAEYWDSLPDKTSKEKLDGLSFSILAMLDGCNVGFPGFKVIPFPHPDDKQYAIDNGEDYYPSTVDIAGTLHEQYHRIK